MSVVVLVAAILGWGYWHVSSHAALNVSLYDTALGNDRQAYGQVRAAAFVFKDAAGAALAKGKAEGPLGIFSIDHPELGDCRREEHAAFRDAESMRAWRRCFDAQSRWLMTWLRQVRYADVSFPGCRIDRVPVTLRESSNEWWLWWVPHPHIGGPPYTYFDASFWVDSASCRPSSVER
jgi:hypothetical protein